MRLVVRILLPRASRKLVNKMKRFQRLSILVCCLSLLALVLAACGGGSASTPEAQPDVGDPSIGPQDAPVTIIEYGDFGCTTCLGWEKAGVRDQILQQYGDQVRFVWRDFPVITAQSPKAAEAGRCANEQGKFWEYHNLLYAQAPRLSVGDLKSYAQQIGLDTQQFDPCLDSGKYADYVQQEIKDARSLGFIGTPSFLVNDKALIGPASLAEFQALIDQDLNR